MSRAGSRQFGIAAADEKGYEPILHVIIVNQHWTGRRTHDNGLSIESGRAATRQIGSSTTTVTSAKAFHHAVADRYIDPDQAHRSID